MSDCEMHILQGNLVRDPELKKTNGGELVCKLRLSVGVYRTENGQRQKIGSNYYTMTAFKDYAEFLASALRKGDPVKVYGNNLKVRGYKTRDGEIGTDLEIVVNNGDVTVVQYAPRKGRPEEEPKQRTLEEAQEDEDAEIPF